MRLEREQAGDAELLLLLELECGRLVVKPVLEVVPQAGFGQRLFDGAVEFALAGIFFGVNAQTENDIFIHRDR